MALAREEDCRRGRSVDRSGHRTVPTDRPVPPSIRAGSPYYSATEETFQTKRKLRFLAAGAIALLTLILITWFGPSREEVKRRFEIYGAEGPLEIMPEISIDTGQDAIHQLPEAFQELAPPVVEIEPPEPTVAMVEPVPPAREDPASVTAVTDAPSDATEAVVPQAELTLPQQSSPDFIIVKMVRPLYPLNASERDKRLPVVSVNVAVFVDADGRVAASLITANEGGPPFAEAVLAAMDRWEFAWSGDTAPAAGRWLEMSWRFKSPYGSDAWGDSPPATNRQ